MESYEFVPSQESAWEQIKEDVRKADTNEVDDEFVDAALCYSRLLTPA